MSTYSKTITVKSDIQDTFDFVADFRNLDKWNPHDIVELVTKEPLREGSIFNVKTKFNEKDMELDYKIVEWGPPLRAALQAENKFMVLTDTVFLSANNKGTELTYSVNVKFKGIFVLLGPFLNSKFKSLMDNIYELEKILGPV